GIALRLLPPSSETRRKGVAAYASRSERPSTLTAFERPSWRLVPEWPPSPPLTVTDNVAASASTGSRFEATRIHVSVLPAQPTVSLPSSSLSRLISTDPS